MSRSAETFSLIRRIRVWTVAFMVGLVLSGVTAIPLHSELDLLVKWAGIDRVSTSSNAHDEPPWSGWLRRVHSALEETAAENPFLYYGTDWLAFGHFVIAIAFIGALINPVRNQWLFSFGIIACALVVPYALVFGAFRGIPLWWRAIDCSFGVFGLVPLTFCWRWARELEELRPGSARISLARAAS